MKRVIWNRENTAIVLICHRDWPVSFVEANTFTYYQPLQRAMNLSVETHLPEQ